VVSVLDPHVDLFQVDDLHELRTFRQSSKKTPLVLGYLAPWEIEEAIALGAILSLLDPAQLDIVQRAALRVGQTARVHLAIDALMGREGMSLAALQEVLHKIPGAPGVDIVGMYGHFSSADNDPGLVCSSAQIELFDDAIRMVHAAGFRGVLTHMSATSAILAMERYQRRFDAVRLGLGLYGLSPSPALHPPPLAPVLRWRTTVAQVKQIPTGYPIGYGATFKAPAPMSLALLPLGYSDGYDRRLSNLGEVLIGGARCRVVGRVSMNMVSVDVTNVPGVARGDEAILLGEQGNDRITAAEIAHWIGTIHYEVISRISPLLPRMVVESSSDR
jgi:alanine racemase